MYRVRGMAGSTNWEREMAESMHRGRAEAAEVAAWSWEEVPTWFWVVQVCSRGGCWHLSTHTFARLDCHCTGTRALHCRCIGTKDQRCCYSRTIGWSRVGAAWLCHRRQTGAVLSRPS
jgi:hypothetical protein